MAETTPAAELKAMMTISTTLEELEPDSVRRVLDWCRDRFQITGASGVVPPSVPIGAAATGSRTFTDLHDLIDATHPETGTDRVLVVSYWFQVVQQNSDLDSQE